MQAHPSAGLAKCLRQSSECIGSSSETCMQRIAQECPETFHQIEKVFRPLDLNSVFTSEFFGNRWAGGTITWSVDTLGIRALTDEEMALLRKAFQLWDEALESVTFQEVSPNDGGAQIQVGLGETNGLSGYWSASWSTVRTSASITLAPDLDPGLFAVAAAHEIANVLGLGDIDGGGYVESLTSDPFTSFHLTNPNLNYLSCIDFELINQLYGEDSTDYLGYLARLSIFSQVIVGDSNSALAESFSGTDGADLILAYAGADTLVGGFGNDLLFAGNGRDLIIGGDGADEMHGGRGANIFGDSRDGFVDQILIHSDHFLMNPLTGTTADNTSGEYVDILEDLDPSDNIFIEAGFGRSLEVRDTTGGLGLYVDGIIEALYTGNDLSAAQLFSMAEIVAA